MWPYHDSVIGRKVVPRQFYINPTADHHDSYILFGLLLA